MDRCVCASPLFKSATAENRHDFAEINASASPLWKRSLGTGDDLALAVSSFESPLHDPQCSESEPVRPVCQALVFERGVFMSRRVLSSTVLIVAFLSIFFSQLAQTRADDEPLGFAPASRAAELKAEAEVLLIPTPDNVRSLLRTLTEEPHVAGTPADKKTADFVLENSELGAGRPNSRNMKSCSTIRSRVPSRSS